MQIRYERLWDPWLGVPGLAPSDLTMDRFLGLNVGWLYGLNLIQT